MGYPGYPWISLRFQCFRIRRHIVTKSGDILWILSSVVLYMIQCTAGDDGSVADISCMSIFSHVQGLLPRRQLAATRWSAQIPVRAHCFGCISQIKFCWKLPHFRSPDIFYFISKLKIVGPLLNNIWTQLSEGWKVLTKYKSQGVNVLMFHLIKW